MPLFAISSDQGQPLGIYDAEDEREAIRLMNADAGEADLDRDDGLLIDAIETGASDGSESARSARPPEAHTRLPGEPPPEVERVDRSDGSSELVSYAVAARALAKAHGFNPTVEACASFAARLRQGEELRTNFAIYRRYVEQGATE